jgi:hypothetical protein
MSDVCPICQDQECILNPKFEKWDQTHGWYEQDSRRYNSCPTIQNKWCESVGAPLMWLPCPQCRFEE